MREFLHNKPWRVLALLGAAGLALRWGHVILTFEAPMHPDFSSFLEAARAMTSPFDTDVREPGFVWWLRLLTGLGAGSNGVFRACTALWFLPALAGLHVLARRILPPWGTWTAIAFYTFLPAQVVGDTLGLRHVIEAAAAVWLAAAIAEQPSLNDRRCWITAAAAALALAACRVTHMATAGLLLGLAAVRARHWRPLAALLPALVVVGFHMANNTRVFGNPTESVDRHTYWFANLEYIGRPGFPADRAEWERDSYRKSLTFRQWAFEAHTPAEFVKETALGYARCLQIFFRKVYFNPGGRLAPLAWLAVGLYLWGLALAALRPALRWPAAAVLVFLAPYAFVSHVFWAGRFFVPISPFVLILLSAGADDLRRRLSKAGKPGRTGGSGPVPPA